MEHRRIWEIDLLRAIALVLMSAFHAVYDLNLFAGIEINYQSGFWFWEGRVSALIFIFLAGISSGFSRNTVKRGLKVLASAMVITLITLILFREQYIRFGILHLLGTGMILFPLLKRVNNFILLVIAVFTAYMAIPLSNFFPGTSLLIPFGILYPGFSSLDYYPLVPYFSMFILGVLAYKLYYYKKQSLFRFRFENEGITAISKNSLAIYLIHQPLIIAIIFLVNFVLKSIS